MAEPQTQTTSQQMRALEQEIQQALNDDTIPEIHCNGFVNVMGSGDVLIVLKRQNKYVCKVTMSFTVAKTLAQKLGRLIANLEQTTGQTILTTDDIQQATTTARQAHDDSE